MTDIAEAGITEVAGTPAADVIVTDDPNAAYFGVQGDDTFDAANGGLLAGGRGNDTYALALGTVALVADGFGSTNDVVDAQPITLGGATTVVFELEGRHLVVGEEGDVTTVLLVLDWLDPERTIEQVAFADQSFVGNFDAATFRALPNYAGDVSIDQFLAAGLDPAFEDLVGALDLVLARADELGATPVQAGTAGANELVGTPEGDTIDGLGGNDQIRGRSGPDLLSGGGDDDTIGGGQGDDVIRGGAGADTLTGGGGNDRIDGGAGADLITGSGGNDVLRGQAGADQIAGSRGADTIRGGGGADTLRGGRGPDDLDGGAGPNTLTGGDGRDRFGVSVVDAVDTVTDFDVDAGDSLDLSAVLTGFSAGDPLAGFVELDPDAPGGTAVSIDPAGGGAFTQIALLQDVNIDSLTADQLGLGAPTG